MANDRDSGARAAQDWILEAKAGDKDAFCELVRAYQTTLRAYLARFIRDQEQVLDLAQDAFLTAYRRMDVFDSNSEFYPWLRGIARMRALEYLRKTRRREHREASAMADWVALSGIARLERDDCGELDYVQELKRCLSELAEASAHVLRLRYFEQKSIEDVAALLNRSQGTVKMMLHRVRLALRACIENERAAETVLE